jgi:hypothetical protein
MAKRRPAASAAAPAQEATAALAPLDYLLQIRRDPEASPGERRWAAEKAAPYLHPRLQSVEHGGEVKISHEDALEALK